MSTSIGEVTKTCHGDMCYFALDIISTVPLLACLSKA